MSCFGNNDPYETHKAPVSGRAVRQGQEMMNPASDPFMVSAQAAQQSRPRVKVSIIAAKGLPPRGSNHLTHVRCMAKNKKSSEFRTKDSTETINPVWKEGGQWVNRWLQDPLVFRVFDKDNSGMMSSLLASEVCIAQAELRCEQFYPIGLRTWIPLLNPAGIQIPGAYLQVEVQCAGVGKLSCWQKIKSWCRFDLSMARDALVNLPATILAGWYSIIGDPVHDRNKGDMGLLILVPLITFLLLTWLGWILKHFSVVANMLIVGVAFCIALGCILVGVTTHKKSKTPFFALGSLMMIAVILGIACCSYGWNECWRQFWWMHTGHALSGSPSDSASSAESRSDVATLTFQTTGANAASVDATRAAGYRQGDVYCAAPILDPTAAKGDIIRVEYWAIGINCCDDFGSFTCDAARETKGSAGVVMKGGGMPCFDCYTEQFRLAAAKAEGANRMVSSPGALYLRFVETPSTITNLYLAKCCFSIFWSFVLGGILFGFLGFITNYKGFGKTTGGHFPLYHMLDPPRKGRQAPLMHEAEAPTAAAAAQAAAQEEADKRFTLVLTPGPNGAMNLASMKPVDETFAG